MEPTATHYPRRFGRYVLLAPLARGGMGQLHLAVTGSATFYKLCVVKQLLDGDADGELLRRFLDEAKVMVRLSHGNLVPVLESGVIESQHFLALEYVDGRDLRQIWDAVVARGLRFPTSLALYVVKELCRGLGFVHSQTELALVHRDVNPPNVLISYAGEVRLADFGLAVSTVKLEKTQPGILLGKIDYMSPEQARGREVDRRSDLFSAGIILWELLTGRRFHGRRAPTLAERLKHAMEPEIVAPSRFNAEVAPTLDEIAIRALAVDREARYQQAEDLRGDVARTLAELDPTTDAAALGAFLRQVYGDEIKRERQEREGLLQNLHKEVSGLLSIDAVNSIGHQLEHAAQQGVAAPFARGELLENTLEARQDSTRPPLIAGKYHIEELVGEGGMGRVYRATHIGIDRTVALKVLHHAFGEVPEAVERFQREARVTGRIGHPNIVQLLDSGVTADGDIYIAMELLEGSDLGQVVERDGPLAVERVLAIGAQICDAMAAAHEAEVIHRDLKPANVFLLESGDQRDVVKIVDFGVAKSSFGDSLTLPGRAIGTLTHMAPEQVESRYDHRVDIYALAVLLYEMLTGRVPFVGNSEAEMLQNKVLGAMPSIRHQRPDVPQALEQLIRAGLDPEPDRRPASMSEMAEQLRSIIGRPAARPATHGTPARPRQPQHEPTIDSTDPLPAMKRDRRPAVLAGVLALLIGAGIAALSSRSGDDAAPSTVLDAGISLLPAERDAASARADHGPPARRSMRRVRPRVAQPPLARPEAGTPRADAAASGRLEGTLDPFKK